MFFRRSEMSFRVLVLVIIWVWFDGFDLCLCEFGCGKRG